MERVSKGFRNEPLNQAVEGAYRSRTGGRFRNEQVNHAGSLVDGPPQPQLVTADRCGFEHGQVVRMDGGWRGVCPCTWRGPLRTHPFDCGPDLIDHQLRKPGACEPEAVQAITRAEA